MSNWQDEFDDFWNNSFLKKTEDVNGEDYDSLKQWIDSNFISKSELKKVVKGMKVKIDREDIDQTKIGSVEELTVVTAASTEMGYNQALTDLLTKLTKEQEE